MSKTGLYRNDIWMCNLKESNTEGLTKDYHPVLIISSWKHICKSELINVIPITSKNIDKVLRSHIVLQGFGLKKTSKLLCEQIITINRTDQLKFKIGAVNDVGKIIEINNMIQKQLDLNKKKISPNEMEVIFFNRDKNIMKETKYLNDLRTEIKKLYDANCMLENEASKLIDELIERASVSSLENKDEYIWYAYYLRSLIYLRYSNYNEAANNTLKALDYIDNPDSNNYCLSMWLLARCFEEIDVNKSIMIYENLSMVYREKNLYKYRISCLFNLAVLKKNIKAAKRLKDIVKNDRSNIWYDDVDKSEIISRMQSEINKVEGGDNVIIA